MTVDMTITITKPAVLQSPTRTIDVDAGTKVQYVCHMSGGMIIVDIDGHYYQVHCNFTSLK